MLVGGKGGGVEKAVSQCLLVRAVDSACVGSADAVRIHLGPYLNALRVASRRTQLILDESDPVRKVGEKRSQNWLR